MAAVSCRNSSSLRLASHLSPPTPPSTSSLMAPVRLGRGHRARRERGVGLGREPCYGTPRLPRSPLQRIIALPGGAAPRAAPARPRRRGPRSGAASFILAFLSHFPTDSGRNMAAGATWSDRASAAGSARLGDSGGKRGPWRRRRPSVSSEGVSDGGRSAAPGVRTSSHPQSLHVRRRPRPVAVTFVSTQWGQALPRTRSS
jgi:hypothetical protein